VARVRAPDTKRYRRQFGDVTNSRHSVRALGRFPTLFRNAGESDDLHQINLHGTRDDDATPSPVLGPTSSGSEVPTDETPEVRLRGIFAEADAIAFR